MDARDLANRDLLVGLLALQNGLIDQDVLVAAFRAWSRDKARPITEILVAQGAIDLDERSLLEGLAAKHLARNGGDAVRSLASIEAAPATRYLLAGIGDPDIDATVSQVGSGSGGSSGSFPFPGAEPEGQRFRVIRPHAQGGLGAVFVALDGELNREVALKQILDHHADDPGSRTRFVLEAEITGGLEHPGIVPVYGLGSYGDGRPYYAMRFVRGDSFKEAIAAFHADPAHRADPGVRSLSLRKLLRRFVDVCNAIDYAHTRGVLHRDIKPANVILGKHGETLVVDWGLAKLLGKPEVGPNTEERTLMPASASGTAETLPGSAMGTPAFMSPEQAAGDLDSLGPRSDVYSLGATLYALLTGKTPFEGLGLLAVLKAVEKGDFPHPRSIDASIPRPLEAVCLKAMALKPADRYASPKALADEIERWSADEPVTAWREPFLVRAGRWGRRHRSAVGAIGLSLATAVVLLTISNIRVSRAQRETAKALERADVNFRRARQAVEDSFTVISQDMLLEEPGMQPLRQKLMQSALKYHEAFLKERADDPSVEAELAQSNFRYGIIAVDLGRRDEALARFREARSRCENLARRNPGRRDYRRMIATIDSHLGSTLERESGGTDPGIGAYLKAIAGYEALLREEPGDVASLEGLATTLSHLGHLKSERIDGADEAFTVLASSRDIRRKLLAKFPTNLIYRRDIIDLHVMMFSRLVGDAGRQAEALASAREARATMDELLKLAPRSPDLKFKSAALYSLDASFHARANDYKRAFQALMPAIEIYTALSLANPEVPIFRSHVARSKVALGSYLNQTGRPAEAVTTLREACEIIERAEADGSGNFSDQKVYLTALSTLADSLTMAGRKDQAVPVYRRAAEVSAEIAKRDPTDIFLSGQTFLLKANLGYTLHRLDRHREATEAYEQARAIAGQTFGDPDWAHDFKEALIRNIVRAYSLREIGRSEEATTIVEKTRPDCTGVQGALFELARYDARGATIRAKEHGRDDEVRSLEDRAFGYLRGLADRGQLRSELGNDPTILDQIRGHPGYRLLVLDLAFPADPFKP